MIRDRLFFSFVAVCFLLSFCRRRYAVDRGDAYLLRAAMGFTAAADFCMLILYQNTAGLAFFCLVQTIYHFRYQRARGKYRYAAAQAAACLILLAILTFFTTLPWRDKLAVCYAAAIACAVIAAAAAGKKYPPFAPAGMILFLLCDINVGLYNLPDMAQHNVFQTLIWVFYLPSQALLCVSARRIEKCPRLDYPIS